MEDEKIIDLYWNRDQGAIGHTAEKYGSYCGRIAKNILLNKEDCEECVNDTWLRAWNAMPDERPAILSAFLGAITRNLSLDRYRKLHTAKRGKGEVEFIFDELTDQEDKKEPSHYIEEQELVACINHFLKNLPKPPGGDGLAVAFLRDHAALTKFAPEIAPGEKYSARAPLSH